MALSRVPTAVFALATVGVLAAGGWWWQASAPVRPAPAQTVPPGQPVVPSARAAAGAQLSEMWAAGADDPVVAVQEPVDVFTHGPLRHPVELAPGAYEIQLACLGDGGTLRVELSGVDGLTAPQRPEHACGPEPVFTTQPLLVPEGATGTELVMALEGGAPGVLGGWRLVDRREPGAPADWLAKLRAGQPEDPAATLLKEHLIEAGQHREMRLSLPRGAFQVQIACVGDTMVQARHSHPGGEIGTELFCDGSAGGFDIGGGRDAGVLVLTGLGTAGSAWTQVVVRPAPAG